MPSGALHQANARPGTPASPFSDPPRMLDDATCDSALALFEQSKRPLVLAGPVMSDGRAGDVRKALASALGVPVLCLESPRGLNDPALGALAQIVARADLIVLLGKQPDFTLRFAQLSGDRCGVPYRGRRSRCECAPTCTESHRTGARSPFCHRG